MVFLNLLAFSTIIFTGLTHSDYIDTNNNNCVVHDFTTLSQSTDEDEINNLKYATFYHVTENITFVDDVDFTSSNAFSFKEAIRFNYSSNTTFGKYDLLTFRLMFRSGDYIQPSSLDNGNTFVDIDIVYEHYVKSHGIWSSESLNSHNLYLNNIYVQTDGFNFYLPSLNYSSNAYQLLDLGDIINTSNLTLSFDVCTYSENTFIADSSAYDDGYSAGYDIGFSEGQANGYSNGYQSGADSRDVDVENSYTYGYDLGYDVGVSAGETSGYQTGYTDGYGVGLRDGEQISSGNYTFQKLFTAIADVPIYTLRNLLGFDVFGINAFRILISMIGGLVALHIIRKFIL